MAPHALHWNAYHCKVLFTIDNYRDSVLSAHARIIECRWYIFPSIVCSIKYRYLNVNNTTNKLGFEIKV